MESQVTESELQEQPQVVKAEAERSENVLDRFVPRKVLINRSWVMNGGLAILDQGLFTGSNFVISVLLARWLPAEQYGSYAIAFAVFVLLLNLCQAVLLEPMLVYGSSTYRNCLRGYLKSLLLLHLGVTSVIVFILCVSAGVVLRLGQQNGLPGALVGVAFATPCVVLFWLAKRAFYLKLSPAPSVGGALLYCALAIGGLTLVYRHGLLSPLSALLLMGLAGLGASVVLLICLGLRLPSSHDAPTLLDTCHQHCRYGRWAVGANVMMWIPVSIYYPLLSSFSGMAQAGELKALMNFASPVLQACAALTPLMLPYAVRVLEEKGDSGISFALRRMTLLCVSGVVPYWLLLLVFKGPAFRMLYSGRYTEVANLLPIVALVSLFGGAFYGPSNTLRSMGLPRLVFAAVSVSTCISIAIGIPLTRNLGVKGAVWSMTLSEALSFVSAVVLLRRMARGALQSVPTVPVLSTSK